MICPSCRMQTPSYAVACPHCTRSISYDDNGISLIHLMLILIPAGLLAGAFEWLYVNVF